MPRCEICYEDVEKTYTCKNCKLEFCEECGDPKKKLCMLCLEEEEEENEDEEEEEDEEDEPEKTRRQY